MSWQTRERLEKVYIMSAENNIILITDDNNTAQILESKLGLLRGVDNVLISPYSDAVENIKSGLRGMVLLDGGEDKEKCLGLLREIKNDEDTKNIPVLLIVREPNPDFIVNAYDENISDYITARADDTEFLIRTIWCLRKKILVDTVEKQYDLLQGLGVIDKESGFYTNEYCEKILNNEFENLRKLNADGILMLISASEESKTTLSPHLLARVIRNSTRNSDVIVHGSANRIYILLKKTPMKGAFCVLDKIKHELIKEHTINASASPVGDKSFNELKEELLNALIESVTLKQDLVIADKKEEPPETEDWLENVNPAQKNFKLFKQAFMKKLDKVITPVFFQMQKLYEDKLFKTQIEQYSNQTQSSFVLKRNDSISELKITYPGFSKINVDVIHQGLDSPENIRISLDLTELDDSKLTTILEDFIQEFKKSE